MSVELEQFHDTFFIESFEALDSMEGALLKLESGAADSEAINTVFRATHSVKGGAGMFGFREITQFTHTLETLLDALRSGRLEVTAQICNGLLQSVDQLRALMAAAQKQQPLDMSAATVLQEMFNRLVAEGAAAPPSAAATVPASGSAGIEKTAWHIRFRPLPELFAQGNDPLRLFEELAGLGEIEVRVDHSGLPALVQMDPAKCLLAWDLVLKTSLPRTSIDLILEWVEGVCELEVTRLQDAEHDAKHDASSTAAAAAQQARVAPADVNTIRVAAGKIDELLNAVGEIVIAQSTLSLLASHFEGAHADRLRGGLAQLESHIRELQQSVMRVRMLPAGSAFSRFPRLVHDLSARLGKRIRLQVSGEHTELDKTMLEKIADPLVHLVRNSIDHGIETPAVRVAAGKSAEGTIHLDAVHKGGSISVIVSDDGRGLDRARILETARAAGLIDTTAELSAEEVHELIFQPGFSTVAETTDLSGRGVGMDVVRRNIGELGGRVDLSSRPGKGTTTTITLPLTLAIIDGQSVAVGGETYIVPLVAIVESLQLRAGIASEVCNYGEVIPFRGEYLPIIRLHETFGVEPRSRNLSDGLIMVVEGDGRRAGLFIDELLGQQQVVIKSLETNYARVEGIGGATILGEGAVALILDVPGLLRMSSAAAQRNDITCARKSARTAAGK